MTPALSVQVGPGAAATLATDGWQPEHFTTLLGASGGPKWLILGALDKVLSRRLLTPRRAPIDLVGSSIGTWRHACLSQADPIAAIDRFAEAYIHQQYSARPTPHEVSDVATQILEHVLGAAGSEAVVVHPSLRNHIVTARARGIARGVQSAAIILGMGTAAVANAVDRRLLRGCFQRCVFSQPASPLPPLFVGFDTAQQALSAANVISALKASGAIPMVLAPETRIPGAPAGPYWDGGIIDYHFEPHRISDTSGLILYPHFTDTLTPGWFDKFLPWRAGRAPLGDSLVLVSPSRDFVAGLPMGKIPDRRDFTRLDSAARLRYWRDCWRAGEALADAFEALLDSADPLAGVSVLPARP